MRCGPPGVGRVESAPQGADCVRLPGPWTGSPVSSTQGRRQQRGAVAHTDHEAEPGHLHSVVPWSPQRPEEPDHSFLCTCDLLSGPRAPDPALASGSPSSEEPRPPPPASRGSVLCPLCCGGASSAGWEWGLLHLTARALSPCSFLPQCRGLAFTEPSFTPPLFTIQPCVVQCGSH